MKACIIIPSSDFLDNDKVFVQLGPYYIKRFVEENSAHTVDVLFNPAVSTVNKYDIIGFSVTTPQYEQVDKYLTHLSTNKVTILGGPHTETYAIDENRFTHIIVKDGCRPFLNILDGKEPLNESDDTDQLPHRDLSLHEYKYTIDGLKATHAITSRGCPYLCKFCESARTMVRYKSIEAVQKELVECVELGFESVMFFDDLFCVNTKRVKALCSVIKPLNIKFRCFAHANSFTEEMAQVLKESNCVELGFGAEHASQKILDIVDKRTKAKSNYDLVRTAHKYGIRVKAFLMIGLPGEDHETVKELEKFILTFIDNPLFDYDLTIYYPFVGTEIAKNIDKYDLFIENENTDAYYKGKLGASTCVVRTAALSSEEIKGYQTKLYSHNKRWKTT